MKCQNLFYGKNKKNISICRMLKILQSMLSVNPNHGTRRADRSVRTYGQRKPRSTFSLCSFATRLHNKYMYLHFDCEHFK